MQENEPENLVIRPGVKTQGVESKPSFDAVLSERWPKVHTFLARLVGDSDEAEDLALETFLRLYDHFERIDNLEKVGAWLYRVAMRLGLNALRARKRRGEYEPQLFQAEENESGQNPTQRVERRERQAEVQAVLAEIPPQAAQLLILRFSGLSYQELAETLDVPVHSIGKMLSRAEAQFEKRYRASYGEPK